MSERCPLSSGSAPGFRYGGEFPAICNQTCDGLWDEAIKKGGGTYELYEDVGLFENTEDCGHQSLEYSHDSLQAVAIGSATRLYTTVDYCLDCGTEVGETSYTFECPKP